jgi:hypothetical protein
MSLNKFLVGPIFLIMLSTRTWDETSIPSVIMLEVETFFIANYFFLAFDETEELS